MTPSTGVLNYIAAHADEMEIAIDQVEDEVAALNMALGASYAGVRAMTGSSGGGFALMVEALSLAGMIEVPVVVINVQRPGPATGFPLGLSKGGIKIYDSCRSWRVSKNDYGIEESRRCFLSNNKGL